MSTDATDEFLAARDLLLDLRDDHDAAYARFRWPRPARFNWALDWFDRLAADNDQPALLIVDGDRHTTLTYAELAERSNRVANWMREVCRVRRGDRVLLMLDNRAATWEALLAAMKCGAVIVPTYTTATVADLADRIERGQVTHVITSAEYTDNFATFTSLTSRICVGEPVAGWLHYADAYAASRLYRADAPTQSDELLFLYFTSGTTARPKLVAHTHLSYPVGHLSGMYWNGLRPGDIHLNVSAPGWAKHAWSSVFGPFNAGATVLSVNSAGGSARPLLDAMSRFAATSFCAPPTVWRMLVQHDLTAWPTSLREVSSVGEPLNPEVIDQVRTAWGLTVRDGYGQTETTAQVGNSPGLAVKPGSMGKALPGYRIVLVDPDSGREADEGEICVDLSDRPVPVMSGYLGAPAKNAETFAGGYYHTGDIGVRDRDGYLTYVGRTDDVFKSYDHRISPFELESRLLEHEAVVEAAVVPAPDPVGLVVPKAYVTLRQDVDPTLDTARRILAHAHANLATHQWIRRMEFSALPKTTSGKIRRAELRAREQHRTADSSGFGAEELLDGPRATPSAPGL